MIVLFKNKNFKMAGIYLLANLFNKAIAFITVPVFTRLLTTGEYGIVSTYSSYVMILQYFIGLSSEYTIRNAYIDYQKDIKQYMASVYSLSCVCAAIVSIIVLILNKYIFFISSDVICVCCLIQAFMTFIINAMSYKLMMQRNHIQRAALIALPNLFSVICGIIFILLMKSHREMGRILGYVVSLSFFGLLCIMVVFKSTVKPFSSKYWRYILKISPPLIIHGLSVILLAQFDRIMITLMKSSSETGIYSIIYSYSMIASAVTQAMQSIWTPWFTEKYKSKDYKTIDKKASQYLYLTAILTALVMLIAPEILKIMTPNSYWSGISMVPPLVITSYFLYAYSYHVGLELHEKKTKTISASTFIATIINIILNYIFIPKYGALAAAYTTLFSYILLFLFHWRNSQKINSKVLTIRYFLLPSLIAFFTGILFYLTLDIAMIRWLVSLMVFLLFTITLKKERIFDGK